MTIANSRRQFLKSLGLASSLFSMGFPSLAEMKERSFNHFNNAKTTQAEHPYELMVCDYVRFQLLKVNKKGDVVWRHKPEGKVWDFVLTDDNKVIYPIITETQEVRCIDFHENIIWNWPYAGSYREIINITRHKSQLILSGQLPPQAVMISMDGKIQRRLPMPTKYQHHHGQLGNVYPSDNNHFLVQLWGEGTVLEVDGFGTEVWRYSVPKKGNGRYPAGTVQDVLRLDNGNTLVVCGTQARLLEVDRRGKIAWEFTANDYPDQCLQPSKTKKRFHPSDQFFAGKSRTRGARFYSLETKEGNLVFYRSRKHHRYQPGLGHRKRTVELNA